MPHTSFLPFLLFILKPFRWYLGIVALCVLFWSIESSLSAYVLKCIVNQLPTITPSNVMVRLGGLAILSVSLPFAHILSSRLYHIIWLNFSSACKQKIGALLMDNTMHHSVRMIQDQFAGNLAGKIKDVMSGIPDLVQVGISLIFRRLSTVIAALTTITFASQIISILMFLWIIIYLMGTLYFSRYASEKSQNVSRIRSIVMGQMVDMLTNVMSIRLFSALPQEQKRFNQFLNTYKTADRARDWSFFYLFSFQGISFISYLSACMYFLLRGFSEGIITPGDFAMVFTLNHVVSMCLWQVSDEMAKSTDLWGTLKQGVEVALFPLEINDPKDASNLLVSEGKISVRSISFHHKNTPPLFENLSLDILPSQKVGLVGYSGSGKSTFANLILRLFNIEEGEILIDNQNISEFTQDSLHRAIGMIPQDPTLFHRSLMENIRFGRADATDEEVIIAAQHAHAHEFIKELPNGYDSLVGERGIKLSGGQRQRVAIARAFLKNAPILILDEATSQLDSLTETRIQEGLWELMTGKTALVIAHRLSTLLYMDRILVFDKGRIVEDGTHTELLEKGHLYKTLWNTQVGGFLPSEKGTS